MESGGGKTLWKKGKESGEVKSDIANFLRASVFSEPLHLTVEHGTSFSRQLRGTFDECGVLGGKKVKLGGVRDVSEQHV